MKHKLLTTAQVAARLPATISQPVRVVQRWRKKLGIGTRLGRDWLLTEAEAKQIVASAKPGRGCPDFGPNFAKRKRRHTSDPVLRPTETGRNRGREPLENES